MVDAQNLVIGAGLAVAAGFAWFGYLAPLSDGDYGCRQGELGLVGPGVTIVNGAVASVWNFNLETGESTELTWRDFKKVSPREFTIVSENPLLEKGTGTMDSYVCTQGSS